MKDLALRSASVLDWPVQGTDAGLIFTGSIRNSLATRRVVVMEMCVHGSFKGRTFTRF